MEMLSKLIAELKELKDIPADQLLDADQLKDVKYFNTSDEKINNIAMNAADIFLDGSGCEWLYTAMLQDAGYYAYPGERDDFGWVTGYISIQNPDEPFERVLVFG